VPSSPAPPPIEPWIVSWIATKAKRSPHPRRTTATLEFFFARAYRVAAHSSTLRTLSDAQLAAYTSQFTIRLAHGDHLDDLAEEAFAVVREAARRVLGLEHYLVQLVGGFALHSGAVAEMGTGEGKTLLATCPAYLHALTGRGVHIVTVNEYLAARDARQMGEVFKFLGLTVGLVLEAQSPEEKRAAYASDVVYVTAQGLGFDHLRSRSAARRDEVVNPRAPYFCIVDEVDSILIDLASNPLILTEMSEVADADRFQRACEVVTSLSTPAHYTFDLPTKTATLTDAGSLFCERALGCPIWDTQDNATSRVVPSTPDSTSTRTSDTSARDPWGSYLSTCLTAMACYKRDVDYTVTQGRVVLIDQETGRAQELTRLQRSLHIALEALEGVEMQPRNRTLAACTYQTLFRYYTQISGMTGTAQSEQEEFRHVYGLPVYPIPPNKESQRLDLGEVWYRTQHARNAATARMIAETWREQDEEERAESSDGVTVSGRKRSPFLLGTGSIEQSEALGDALRVAGVAHQVLNARPDAALREASIVAQAGRPGMVTIATNMAGRGTDIILGGNAPRLADDALECILGVAWGSSTKSDSPNFTESPNSTPSSSFTLASGVTQEIQRVRLSLLDHIFSPDHPPPSAWRAALAPESLLDALLRRALERNQRVDLALDTDPDIDQNILDLALDPDIEAEGDSRALFAVRTARRRVTDLAEGRSDAWWHNVLTLSAAEIHTLLEGETGAGAWTEHRAMSAALLVLEALFRVMTSDSGRAVREGGGLCVISANIEPSVRAELQLLGRVGRQGDPGRTFRLWALDDPFLRDFGLQMGALEVAAGAAAIPTWEADPPHSRSLGLQDLALSGVVVSSREVWKNEQAKRRAMFQQEDAVLEVFRDKHYALIAALLSSSDVQLHAYVDACLQYVVDTLVSCHCSSHRSPKAWRWAELAAELRDLLQDAGASDSSEASAPASALTSRTRPPSNTSYIPGTDPDWTLWPVYLHGRPGDTADAWTTTAEAPGSHDPSERDERRDLLDPRVESSLIVGHFPKLTTAEGLQSLWADTARGATSTISTLPQPTDPTFLPPHGVHTDGTDTSGIPTSAYAYWSPQFSRVAALRDRRDRLAAAPSRDDPPRTVRPPVRWMAEEGRRSRSLLGTIVAGADARTTNNVTDTDVIAHAFWARPPTRGWYGRSVRRFRDALGEAVAAAHASRWTLAARVSRLDPDQVCDLQREVVVETLKNSWMVFLDEAELSKESGRFRAFAAEDPLHAYATRLASLDQQTTAGLRKSVVKSLGRTVVSTTDAGGLGY
jgi:preprotein translocase subunit SecA